MKLKEDKLDIYNNSAIILNRQAPRVINTWIIILIATSIIFIFCLLIPFNIYKTYNGYIIIENNNTYINLVIDKTDFPINKNNKLYIKDMEYKYEIINIERDSVLLEVNIKDNINIKNNIVVVNILKEKTTILEIIKNKIKKGFGL